MIWNQKQDATGAKEMNGLPCCHTNYHLIWDIGCVICMMMPCFRTIKGRFVHHALDFVCYFGSMLKHIQLIAMTDADSQASEH